MSTLLSAIDTPTFYWVLAIVSIACAGGIPGAVLLVDRLFTRHPLWNSTEEVVEWPRAVAWAGMALLVGAFVTLALLCRTIAA